MNVSISIITDDSKTVFPGIHKWKGMSRGKTIGELKDETSEILLKYNLSFPTTDLKLEPKYKEVLHKYVRPAKFMFTGPFSEVRSFSEEIKKYGDVSLYLLSGRYGVIDQEVEIIPYDSTLNDEVSLRNLDLSTSFSDNIKSISLHSDIVIFLLPKQTLEYLIEKRVFEVGKILKIAVCSKSTGTNMEKLGFEIFNRPGVARIGVKNKEKILEIIKKYSTTK